MALGCNLHVASGGNRFMVDLAGLLAAALSDLSVRCAVVVDEVPRGDRGTADVIVAPQEWFVVGPDLELADKIRISQRCAMVTTEQPGSHWWEVQRPWIAGSPLLLDISPVGAAALVEDGLPALHLPLGYHEILDAWGGESNERDVDVSFMGSTTQRRRAALARLAPVLSHRDSRILLHDPRTPVTAASRNYLEGRAKAELLARTKVLVNIHRGDGDYFEWVRALEAMANGALLLTETSEGWEPLEPFVHLVAAQPDDLRANVVALLADEALRAKIAREAYDFVRSELVMADLLRVDVLPALNEAAEADLEPLEVEVRAPGPNRPAGPPYVAPPSGPEHRTHAALKKVLLDQMSLRRRFTDFEMRSEGLDPLAFEDVRAPGWESVDPDVSVVVPLYEYEATIESALESVAASRNVEVEVIVVEDRSRDGSRAVVERFMEAHPDVALRLIARASNRGLAAARNLGISLARSDRCFLLDADNAVYPDALWKLARELDETGAAAAYCILEVFESEPDLVSALPWNLRTLALGPYIDAMSMLHRPAWEAVGGFREDDDVIHGWEDYALWLTLAARGYEAAWVPEPLARYRRHGGSMTSITALDLATPLNHLRRELPELPW